MRASGGWVRLRSMTGENGWCGTYSFGSYSCSSLDIHGELHAFLCVRQGPRRRCSLPSVVVVGIRIPCGRRAVVVADAAACALSEGDSER